LLPILQDQANASECQADNCALVPYNGNRAYKYYLDGYKVNGKRKRLFFTVLAELTKQSMGTGDYIALTSTLEQLGDMIDGLSDALTAEAAYQMARGNTSRMASTLSAIAQGDAPPPELEVTRTPRSGTSLTHRLLLMMSATTNLNTPGWLGAQAAARSRAEPLLNFWVAKLLGDGSLAIFCRRVSRPTGFPCCQCNCRILHSRRMPLAKPFPVSNAALYCSPTARKRFTPPSARYSTPAHNSCFTTRNSPAKAPHITCQRRLTRWTDGSTWLWTSFRNQVGTGEGSSGLKFDQVLEPSGSRQA
jgi:hypothetical protein